MAETPQEPPGYAERDDEPTTEQTGGGVEEVPRPDQGADPEQEEGAGAGADQS